ncbi:hypothetical protein L227DRAFT_576167 [Lentinus tigrinus ALCF2SS1-6]|uniref:Uncharacterized protein n=1 Tax=Lentinus tigrinus ALCF2SS1-6 TaxID=1328759 RepID=A0A5C2S9A4_9APHY|nr:hypothetical protein L227DRAFT_576167 [Lentinus tigrinus ALCF2SS1-6]
MPSRTSSSSLPSAPSMVSVTSTTTCASSSTSASSTPTLTAPSPSPSSSKSQPKPKPKKDYAAAFTAMQLEYGWGHHTFVPIESAAVKEAQEKKRLAKEAKALEKARRKEAKAAGALESEQGQPPRTGKDYESAFGALSSKMGWGSWMPSPGPRKQ